MSRYLDEQAEESEHDDDSILSDASEPVAKKSKKIKEKKKRKHQISSDEEDEDGDDDDQIRREMKDFVVEEDEEVDGGENSEGDNRDDDDRSDRGGDSDIDLSDEDVELIQENTGQAVGGRVLLSDDDEEDDRERIKEKLFGRYGANDVGEDPEERPTRAYEDDELSRSESEQSEEPFIVNDDGGNKGRRRKNRMSRLENQFLDDARDVFGVEDIDDFYDEEEGFEDEAEETEEGVAVKSKATKVSLWNAIEPSELDKGFVSAADKRIIFEDRPERHQLRKIPVSEIDDQDLNLEVSWVHKYAFQIETLTKQHQTGLSILNIPGTDRDAVYKAEMEAAEKIREALRFIKNQHFEVPFIAFYRKEYVESSLHMSDLWKVYQYDEKWCRLQQRKTKVFDLLKRVQLYIQNSETAISLRKITEKDFFDVTGVQVAEELSDVYSHFQLYYGNEMSRVHEWEQLIAKEKLDATYVPKFKLCGRTDKYLLCMQCGLGPMAEDFGLTPSEFAENVTEYVKHDARQNDLDYLEVAKDYTTDNFPNPEDVVTGAIYVLAQQFSREPAVRKKLRAEFRRRLKITVYPTKKGRDEIDDKHPLYGRHYIKDKPVSGLENEEYLQYIRAKNDDLVEVKLYCDTERDVEEKRTLLDEITKEPIFHRDEHSDNPVRWNDIRMKVLHMCVNELLIPIFEREAHERLLEEARECVLRKCSSQLSDKIATEAYKPTFRYDNDDEDSIRIMSICYTNDLAEASFALVIDQDGMVLEHQRLVHFNRRAFARLSIDSQLKKDDMEILRKFILRQQPHLIGVNGEDLEALRLSEDVRRLIKNMNDERELIFSIPVEIIDNDAAKVYMNSRMAIQEVPDFPPLLKQALSLARFMLDPLVEVCHLCNTDDDILFMSFHPMQSEIAKSDLLFALQLECINRVNEVGVDINRCLEFPHTAGLLQFVCGLGPRKANHLLKMLKQNDNLLESRTKLVTFCRMGPKVFMNAAGFIKIDTTKVGERTDAYVEVLDGSRVHPETYEWARKMAVDALEIEDPADPTGALEEILQAPERLKDLDLDAFAEELARQGFGDKQITLYDIRAELNYRYKDLRSAHKTAEGKDLFDMLVKDGEPYSEGKLVCGRILYVVHRKLNERDLNKDSNKMQPILNSARNTWACAHCKQEFHEVSHVWEHKDQNQCPGVPVGVKVRLENGITGFVSAKNISDKADPSGNTCRLLQPGRDQMFRVLKMDMNRLQCELSCKTSDLQGSAVHRDRYFDENRYKNDRDEKVKAKTSQIVQTNFIKRVITHPSFHNVDFKQAELMLKDMDPGDAIVRPSAKSMDHLTVTWKVTDDIYQHINIREEKKAKVFDIGKVLYINEEAFEDLDEIIARHIQPMAGFARDIMSYKYYMENVNSEDSETIEKHLHEEKQRYSSKIPYTLTPSTKYPGKFVLSYLAQKKVRHEYLSATPQGIKFRYQLFQSTEALINWFKLNYMHRPEMFKK